MAGAGYRLFNTGDVLTAQQVNEYLQQQVIMRFANSAARTAALSGVLAEGMASWLDDTNSFEVYNGSAWVSASGDLTGLTAGTGITITDPTGPVPTITNDVATEFDTKGDLIVGTGADSFDKLVAGGNGETLVADSSTSTGLAYREDYAAGKNKIINGDFRINQRAFTSATFTTATFDSFGFDRWKMNNAGDGTSVFSTQAFTLGTAPVAGYEGSNFLRVVTSGFTNAASRTDFVQSIESVRTFANETIVISFFAKANSGTPQIGIEVQQNFGTGGSPSTTVNTPVGAKTIGTTWQRYSISVAVPSIAGKTIGTNNNDHFNVRLFVNAGSDLATRASSIGIQNNTFEFWGIQAEAGSVATAFQTATGTLAGELAACQRYLPAIAGQYNQIWGIAYSTTGSAVSIKLPTTARVKPTGITVSSASHFTLYNSGFTSGVATGITFNQSGTDFATINIATTAGSPTIAKNEPIQLEWTNASSSILFTGCEL